MLPSWIKSARLMPGTEYRRAMLTTSREEFVARRNAGDIDDEVLRRLLHELDLEEATLDRDAT